MTLLEFGDRYGTEEQCREHLYRVRWPEGYACPKCGHNKHYDIKSRNLYQCKACNHQASVTAGTIMDKTKTPLRKWFLAMYLMAEDKRGISALSLKGKIGVAYQTAWSMCQKIRHAMGQREEGSPLNGIVEFDDAFFGSPTEGGKRGRGTKRTVVLVSVSLTENGKPKYAKMKAVASLDFKSISTFAREYIEKGSEIRADGYRLYTPLSQKGYKLQQKPYNPKSDPGYLHWLHIIISNAKAYIKGTYHGLDELHLQRYLNEFCFRFNRRRSQSGVFTSLVNTCARSSKITYYELTG